LKAGSHPEEIIFAAPGKSTSVSVGELWPGIDVLDEGGLEGTSAVPAQEPRGDQILRSRADPKDQEDKARVVCA
jgi:hypothetical protein